MPTLSHGELDQAVRNMIPVAASQSERPKLKELSRILLEATRTSHQKKCFLVGPDGEKIPLPELASLVLEHVSEVLARGDSVTVIPVGKELTTQQAANLLNISRQYLLRLLETNQIPFTKTGRHRRLRIEDVLQYKAKRDQERRVKLEELIRLSEETEDNYAELRR
jgi:excisionase family DNA binding protein